MNETILDKKTYQTKRRRICWAALGMMIVCTLATIYDPALVAKADQKLILLWYSIYNGTPTLAVFHKASICHDFTTLLPSD
jgi:hypothetical protein